MCFFNVIVTIQGLLCLSCRGSRAPEYKDHVCKIPAINRSLDTTCLRVCPSRTPYVEMRPRALSPMSLYVAFIFSLVPDPFLGRVNPGLRPAGPEAPVRAFGRQAPMDSRFSVMSGLWGSPYTLLGSACIQETPQDCAWASTGLAAVLGSSPMSCPVQFPVLPAGPQGLAVLSRSTHSSLGICCIPANELCVSSRLTGKPPLILAAKCHLFYNHHVQRLLDPSVTYRPITVTA